MLRARTVWRIAAPVVAIIALLPSVALAQTPDTDGSGTEADVEAPEAEAPDTGPSRVSCDEASEVFYLLCETYELITTRYVDQIGDEDLAAAAAQGARDADLGPRTVEPVSPCALPAPEFEVVCAEIDSAAKTSAAVWAATARMLASLGDPNMRLLTPAAYQAYQLRRRAAVPFAGIGLRLGLLDGTAPCKALSDVCRLTIAEVFPASPAEHAGLRADDIVLELDGLIPSGPGCGISDLRRFDPGTQVMVKVERDGRVRHFVMKAALVDAPGIASRIVGTDLGYVRLGSFGFRADQAVDEELQRLIDSGMESLVLDLSGNPGGYLSTVVDMASLFLDDRQVVTQEVSRHETLLHLATKHEGFPDAADLPMAVAVDGSSASASELLSLALRDHGRATIVGATTYGKNTGQITQSLESDDGSLLGAVRLTVLRWFSPDGHSALGGIEPDVVVGFAPCAHPIGLARQVAAAAGLPGAVLADIGDSGERFDAVEALASDGVLEGTECEPGLFCPEGPLRRWEMAVWLVRLLDGDDPDPVSVARFSDVDPDQWWAAHVERLADLGITAGCGREPARFCPDAPMSRAQMARFLRRAFNAASAVPAGFVDISDRSAAADVSALFAAGIVSGCSTDPMRFCPEMPASRADTAVALARARAR